MTQTLSGAMLSPLANHSHHGWRARIVSRFVVKAVFVQEEIETELHAGNA